MRMRSLLVAAAAGLLPLAVALPATADTTGASAARITVRSGVLSITVRTDAGDLGSRSSSVGAATVRGSLGQVQVSDGRGAPAGSGWVASVTTTAFTSLAGPAIPASAVGYTAGPIAKVGAATYTANDPAHLTGRTAVVTATGISGNNTATWTPTLTVTLPAGTPAGVYSATITHSVA